MILSFRCKQTQALFEGGSPPRFRAFNDQFRLCFAWTDAGPVEVEIVDYH